MTHGREFFFSGRDAAANMMQSLLCRKMGMKVMGGEPRKWKRKIIGGTQH